MGKRNLGEVVRQQQSRKGKTAWDLAAEVIDRPHGGQATPEARPKPQMLRSTDRISISLLEEERRALEDRAFNLRQQGHRDVKMSRLARIAFQMLLDAPDEDILKAAQKVPNLEKLRAVRRSDDGTDGQ